MVLDDMVESAGGHELCICSPHIGTIAPGDDRSIGKNVRLGLSQTGDVGGIAPAWGPATSREI